MKTLIVEDDFTSSLILRELLKGYGSSHIAVNGKEAVGAVQNALDAGTPYDLICLDIMMPEMDGQQCLVQIRAQEKSRGIPPSKMSKIVMTTALGDLKNVGEAYHSLCDAYLVKPVQKKQLIEELHKLGLIER